MSSRPLPFRILASFFLVLSAARAATFTVTPANVHDTEFWSEVKAALPREPAEVIFEDGVYFGAPTILLEKFGDAKNALVLRARNPGKAVFRDAPTDKVDRNNLFSVKECFNVTIRDLVFTGPENIGNALQLANCRDVRVERCRFEGLEGVYFAALSIVNESTDRILVRDCVFRRVGLGGHSHMIYSAYGVQRLSVIDCQFEHCAGDFVRFRDETDRGVVWGCTFVSSGTYRNVNPPMITVPLFNDDDPVAPKKKPNYEYFGTHFLFAHNSFTYGDAGPVPTRSAVQFLNMGYNPPGRVYLLSPSEAKILTSAPAAERKRLLKDQLGIDVNEVHIFDNHYQGVTERFAYRCGAAYGAKSRGWSGLIDLSDLPNATPVAVTNADEAAKFYW